MRAAALLGGWLSLALVAGCPVSGSGGIIVVVDSQDTFNVTLEGFAFSGTVHRTWRCSVGQANLTIGGIQAGGSVYIRIKDPTGLIVYENTHGGSMGAFSAPTRPGGTAGAWDVKMTFSNATWAGNISLQADTTSLPDEINIASGIGVSGSWTFDVGWNAGQAHVDLASGLAAGTLHIVILDGLGAEVYNRTFTAVPGGVSDLTTAGAGGTWTVFVDFSGADLGGVVDLTGP